MTRARPAYFCAQATLSPSLTARTRSTTGSATASNRGQRVQMVAGAGGGLVRRGGGGGAAQRGRGVCQLLQRAAAARAAGTGRPRPQYCWLIAPRPPPASPPSCHPSTGTASHWRLHVPLSLLGMSPWRPRCCAARPLGKGRVFRRAAPHRTTRPQSPSPPRASPSCRQRRNAPAALSVASRVNHRTSCILRSQYAAPRARDPSVESSVHGQRLVLQTYLLETLRRAQRECHRGCTRDGTSHTHGGVI